MTRLEASKMMHLLLLGREGVARNLSGNAWSESPAKAQKVKPLLVRYLSYNILYILSLSIVD
jgi:hypothetical protein